MSSNLGRFQLAWWSVCLKSLRRYPHSIPQLSCVPLWQFPNFSVNTFLRRKQAIVKNTNSETSWPFCWLYSSPDGYVLPSFLIQKWTNYLRSPKSFFRIEWNNSHKADGTIPHNNVYQFIVIFFPYCLLMVRISSIFYFQK